MSLSKSEQLCELVETRDYLKVKTFVERNNCLKHLYCITITTTFLHIAAVNGDIAIVQLLLDHQADVDLCAGLCGEWGRTALHVAAERGHTDVVRLLIEYKADVNKADTIYGKTALHQAAAAGHTDTVKVLIDHHADVNKADTVWGMTALHCAAIGGHTDTVILLLANGADHTARDIEDHTPLDLARHYKHHDTVSAIENCIGHSQQVSCVNISELQANVDMVNDDDMDEVEFDSSKSINQTNHSVPNHPSVLSGYIETMVYVKGDMSEMLLPQWVPSANDNQAASVIGVPYKRVDDPNRVITLRSDQLPSHQPAVIQGKPTEKELSDLAQNIGFEWSRLAIELGLSNFEVDQCQMSFPGDAARQIRAMLIKWRQRSGGQSEAQRYHKLRKALGNVGRNDLAQNIEN